MYYYTIPEYTVLYEHQMRIYEYKLVQQLHALALDGHGTPLSTGFYLQPLPSAQAESSVSSCQKSEGRL